MNYWFSRYNIPNNLNVHQNTVFYHRHEFDKINIHRNEVVAAFETAWRFCPKLTSATVLEVSSGTFKRRHVKRNRQFLFSHLGRLYGNSWGHLFCLLPNLFFWYIRKNLQKFDMARHSETSMMFTVSNVVLQCHLPAVSVRFLKPGEANAIWWGAACGS